MTTNSTYSNLINTTKFHALKTIKSLTPQSIVKAFIFPIGVLILVIGVTVLGSIPLTDLMRDPTAVADIPFYIGFVSNIGILLWCAAAAVCLFSWNLLKRLKSNFPNQSFLFWSGTLTIILLLDDLFLLHEDVFPNGLGISQKIVIGSYLGMVLGWLLLFRNEILASDFSFLLLALGFFGLSVGVDYLDELVERFVGQWRIFFEDGFKLLGIGCWLYYFVTHAKSQIMKHLPEVKAAQG